MKPCRRLAFRALALSFGILGAGAALADSALHLRGAIDAVNTQSLVLKNSGVTVALNAQTRIASLSPAKLSDIKPGIFVGTAAIPQRDGTLKAVEVHIFLESMRGTGEGYRPFPQVPQGTMTNATVTDMAGTESASVDGATLTLTYKDGRQTVVVPKGIPIVLIGPGDAAMLKPEAKVSVTATKDDAGRLTATRILVGRDGVTPPI